MAELINEKDSLNTGRKKLNEAIKDANTAKITSEQADNKATEALANSESTQEQLNQVVIDGDSSVEAAQARVDEKGQSHDTLKDRIDDGFTKVNTQLAETVEDIGDLSNGRNIYKKEVFLHLPSRFPDYSAVVSMQGGRLHPQAFHIDWDKEEVFILYNPIGEYNTSNYWVANYDLDGVYIGCFSTGAGGGSESIVVKNEVSGRFVYVNAHGSIYKYNIDNYTNLSELSVYEIIDVESSRYLSYFGGRWLTGTPSAFGNHNNHSFYMLLDDNFDRRGHVRISPSNIGLFGVSEYSNYVPKTQGLALGDNKIYSVTGNQYQTTKEVSQEHFQGLKVFSMEGELLKESSINPSTMKSVLERNGYNNVTIIENEGVYVSPEGEVYTQLVYCPTSHPSSETDGIIIFKEFSTSINALDFSENSSVNNAFTLESLSLGTYPALHNNLYNPVTGKLINNMQDLCQMMVDLQIPIVRFYYTRNILDFDGSSFGDKVSYPFIIVYNPNNRILRATEISREGVKWYHLVKGGEGWIKVPIHNRKKLYEGTDSLVVNSEIELDPAYDIYPNLLINYTIAGESGHTKIVENKSAFLIKEVNLANTLANTNAYIYEVKIEFSNNKLIVTRYFEQTLNSDSKKDTPTNAFRINEVYGIF